MNNIERAALYVQLRSRYGPDWIDKVIELWATGKDASEPDGHLLRQLRNTVGPSGLLEYKRKLEGK